MTIKESQSKRTRKVTFNDIPYGDIFRYNNELYLRIEGVNIINGHGEWESLNAIRLFNGVAVRIIGASKVEWYNHAIELNENKFQSEVEIE